MDKGDVSFMKAIILAAGRGSRLGNRTQDRPKCMVTVCGKTILSRCIDALEQAGIQHSEIGIVTGYRKECIDVPGVHYFHNAQWESTNMFCSLLRAEEWLKQEPCLVCYSDIIFSPIAIQALQQSNASLALTYYTDFWQLWQKRMEDPFSDLETFRINDKNRLLEIGQKPSTLTDVMGQYMGLIRFTPKSWQWVQQTIHSPLPKSIDKLDMTTLLQAMVTQGFPIETIATHELWLECDTQQDIEVYEKLYASQL